MARWQRGDSNMDVQTIIEGVAANAEVISATVGLIDISLIPDLDVGHGMESLAPQADIGDWWRKIVGLFDLPR
jgi:hypothetical protein